MKGTLAHAGGASDQVGELIRLVRLVIDARRSTQGHAQGEGAQPAHKNEDHVHLPNGFVCILPAAFVGWQ